MPVSYTHLDVYKRQVGEPPFRYGHLKIMRGIFSHRLFLPLLVFHCVLEGDIAMCIRDRDESLGMMPQEESEKYLSLLKKGLSGSLGKNLIDIVFSLSLIHISTRFSGSSANSSSRYC